MINALESLTWKNIWRLPTVAVAVKLIAIALRTQVDVLLKATNLPAAEPKVNEPNLRVDCGSVPVLLDISPGPYLRPRRLRPRPAFLMAAAMA